MVSSFSRPVLLFLAQCSSMNFTMGSFRMGLYCVVLCLGLFSFSSLGLDVELNLVTDDSEKETQFRIYNISLSGPTEETHELVAEENEKNCEKYMSILTDQENRIKILEEFNKKLLDKIDQIEQQTKVNNLIFTNIEESRNENHRLSLKKVLHVLNNVMKLRTKTEDISVALRMDSDNATEARPIVVKFANFATKMKVLAAKNKLKNSKVEISSDYSELVNQKRKDLLPFLIEKRAQGHDTFILYDKLMVDGVKVSLEDLKAERKEEEEKREEDKPKVDLEVDAPTTESGDMDEQWEDGDTFPTFLSGDYEEYY